MALPAPNLDDRRFQDLVDDAKRLIQQRCPEWSDHNVSDPGVTLVEAFAFMVDQLLYRLNRVPDRLHVKFLELVGVRLLPPAAARADVTFWLSAPQTETVRVPEGHQVATSGAAGEAVVFTVVSPRDIVPCALRYAAVAIGDLPPIDHTTEISSGQGFHCFDPVPQPGNSLLIGLTRAVPGCAVRLEITCPVAGVGVDPRRPPLAWEAWDGDGWTSCDVDRDTTGGFNEPGEVVVHVPSSHATASLGGMTAGWLRCRVTVAEPGQPTYSASPHIEHVGATTVGGTGLCAHTEFVDREVLGTCDGVPGQRFVLRRGPVVAGPGLFVLEVQHGDACDEWTAVADFASSGRDDRHVVVDPATGEVLFGPGVREPDGTVRQYGAVPPQGAIARVPRYWTGGGRLGNVGAHTISVLRNPLPFVTRVDNRRPAKGGVDGEDLASAKLRGPLLLRTRNRAVTSADFEQLAREAAPEVARVRTVTPADGTDAGLIRVLLVPHASHDGTGRLDFAQLVPSDETLQRVAAYLDERRLIGSRLVIEPPVYQGITVIARLRARTRTSPARLQRAALEALYRYFQPLEGGPDHDGWPFGRPVLAGEVFAVLQGLPGTELVEDVRLFAVNPVTGLCSDPTSRIELAPNALVFSCDHQVSVEGA